MAWSSISVLAFLLVVVASSSSSSSYASAPAGKAAGIKELCQGSPDADHCVKLFQPMLAEEFVLKSPGWWDDVTHLFAAVTKSFKEQVIEQSHNLTGKEKEAGALKPCIQNVRDSVNLTKAGKMDAAAAQLETCSQSLKDHQGAEVKDVKETADKGSKELKILGYVLAKANLPSSH